MDALLFFNHVFFNEFEEESYEEITTKEDPEIMDELI